MSQKNIKKVIVISGGSKGIGKSLVELYLQDGFSIATCSRSKNDFIQKLESGTLREQFFWQQLDVHDAENVQGFMKNVYTKFGQIDVLINNAGVSGSHLLTIQPYAEIDRLININLTGVIYMTKEACKYMLLQNRGTIITISSILGLKGSNRGLSVYSATKAALVGLTKCLAREYGAKNIRVNNIAPGYLKTEMTADMQESDLKRIIKQTPLNRLCELKDIYHLISFLMSEKSNFITGQTMVIDGGMTS